MIIIYSVAPVPLRTVKLIVGDLNINSTTETQHQRVNFSSITFHSHFDPYYLENDIAVIKLSSPLKFKSGIQPICLPERGTPVHGKEDSANPQNIPIKSCINNFYAVFHRKLVLVSESLGFRMGSCVLSTGKTCHEFAIRE